MTSIVHGKAAHFIHTLLLSAALASAAALAQGDAYQRRNLVSDGFIPAENTDPNLVNGWGVAFNPFGFVWVADNGTGLATLYDGSGKPQPLVVQIPGPAGSSDRGAPTGIVFNGSNDFAVSVEDAIG